MNLIRTSLHALGAVIAGTQAMEVSAFDEALAIPSVDAATLALRVQQVIQEETNVTAVSDPLAGSYFIEALTDQLATAATDLADEVEHLGGYVAAQETGWIRGEIEESARRWRDQIEAGRRRVVGVNCHVEPDEQPTPIFSVNKTVEPTAIDRVRQLRRDRDSYRFERAMGETRCGGG